MSENNATVKKSKFSIVNKIMSALNSGDSGKIESFFKRVVKHLNREISHIESNFNVNNLENIQEIEDLKSAIEDAKANLADAYLFIDVEELKNNASQDAYRETYLDRIEVAEYALETLTDKLESLNASVEEATKTRDEDIANLEARIEKLSK